MTSRLTPLQREGRDPGRTISGLHENSLSGLGSIWRSGGHGAPALRAFGDVGVVALRRFAVRPGCRLRWRRHGLRCESRWIRRRLDDGVTLRAGSIVGAVGVVVR